MHTRRAEPPTGEFVAEEERRAQAYIHNEELTFNAIRKPDIFICYRQRDFVWGHSEPGPRPMSQRPLASRSRCGIVAQ